VKIKPRDVVDTAATLALGVALTAVLVVGCTPAITLKQVEDLEHAIQDERAACAPRSGFETEVAALQSATNNYFDAMKRALSR
jgi:hypothetical protein